MALALFDLDNTLLSNDSDFLWGQFLVKEKLVDADYYEEKNQYFYDEYKKGSLNIAEFLTFSLKPLADNDRKALEQLHEKFMQTDILPNITQQSLALINKHKDKGDYCLIVTATNLFITGPIAQYLKMDDILATVPEIKNNQYTGNVDGIPCFQDGKVVRLNQWLALHTELSLEDSFFYSDSINDLPLLNKVSHPIAVDPDDRLKQHAIDQGWDVISLR